jgi:hypothetical protein
MRKKIDFDLTPKGPCEERGSRHLLAHIYFYYGPVLGHRNTATTKKLDFRISNLTSDEATAFLRKKTS